MPWGYVILIALTLVLLAVRLVRLVRVRRGTVAAVAEPTYPEPKLRLDAAVDQAHDVFGELQATLAADRAGDVRHLGGAEGSDPMVSRRWPVSRKILATGALGWALVGVPYLHPSLGRWRLLDTATEDEGPDLTPIAAGGPMPSAAIGEAKLPGVTYDQQARAKELDEAARDSRGPIAQAGGAEDLGLALAPGKSEGKPPRSIDDPSGKALDRFFAQLARVEAKQPGAVARILYYGDSIVASDFVTGKLRRLLHDRFGDAGHGYALVANAWPGWFHIDVSRKASAEWRVSTCVGPYAKDALYGLGCASFQSHHADIWAELATASIDRWGRNAARFELEYLTQPGGGDLRILVDGEERERLSTNAAAPAVAWRTVTVPDGAHRFEIRSVDERPVRVFGMRTERDVPGVVLSALGVTGARARFLDKQDDAHWAQVLRAAKPDLVCLAFGSNEITDGNMYPMDKYRETLAAVMAQIEQALPDASYMLVGPPDMASKKASHGHTLPMVYFIVKEQKELAAKRGWAFWDQYRAMGAGGSMWAWIKAGLGSPDMFHPTGRGGNVLGLYEYRALMEAFEKYKAARR